ncbi:uroporphyrinogen-III synthase [Geosmithia morbida]|uniref:Uroporphyrinogen-III synthase n=1 Tax=Geosmithia morbida TaxID=1094350 RepID=A0A9P4YR33_9HYPO|nr:uroporphyrinogen-III synthase [Geosmithia morbida]KAF4121553.1 uroporphyrinogen-III synthase [Geosmithia morbida]
MPDSEEKVPILLLKTESHPADAYADLFTSAGYIPLFVPVLQHQFNPSGLDKLRRILRQGGISRDYHPSTSFSSSESYGGLIFTSQRSVEAFAKVVGEESRQDKDGGTMEKLARVPVYSVGPATTRALRAIDPPLQVFGEHTGNGQALADYMLEHYHGWYPRDGGGADDEGQAEGGGVGVRRKKIEKVPALLFPVGEQRRDVIPRTLMEETTPDRRIRVDETVVYGTGVMESFPGDFGDILRSTAIAPRRWVVVFSPTGCDSMLRGLGLLDDGEDAKTGTASAATHPTTYIVTIGPTTQAHLQALGFEPHAVAGKPSPEGVLEAIREYEKTLA